MNEGFGKALHQQSQSAQRSGPFSELLPESLVKGRVSGECLLTTGLQACCSFGMALSGLCPTSVVAFSAFFGHGFAR